MPSPKLTALAHNAERNALKEHDSDFDPLEVEYELSKFQCCVLRCQEGKTFQCLKRIDEYLKEDRRLGKSVHLVFTMNILENNKQFALRCQEFAKRYGTQSVAIIASKQVLPDIATYKNVDGIISLFAKHIADPMFEVPKIILVCSNKPRKDDFDILVGYLQNDKNKIIERVFCYYDELHKYINIFRDQIERFNTIPIVHSIFAMTATPTPIWQASGKWRNITMSYISDRNEADYYGYRDVNLVDVAHDLPQPKGGPGALSTWIVKYVEKVLKANPDILGPNTRSFIPAHILRTGHTAIRDLVMELAPNAVVVVLNGVDKKLFYKDSRDKMLSEEATSSKIEFSKYLPMLIKKLKLEGRPLVITGFLCVGMGQTLMDESLGPFTSAILGHSDLSNDDIYQLFGRLCGRMKTWVTCPEGFKTDVYCPSEVSNRCIAMEDCDRQIAEYAGEAVDKETFFAPVAGMPEEVQRDVKTGERTYTKSTTPKKDAADKAILEFPTQEKAIEFVSKHGKNYGIKLNKRKDAVAIKELCVNGRNPTKEELLKRFWGLGDTKMRMSPTNANTWCIWWRPSVCPDIPRTQDATTTE